MKNHLKSTVFCMVVLVLSCEDVEGVQQSFILGLLFFNKSYTMTMSHLTFHFVHLPELPS